MHVDYHHCSYFPSFSFTLSVFGTCLIVKDNLVLLLMSCPILTLLQCDRLNTLSFMVSSSRGVIPCKRLVYMSSWRTRRLLGSSNRENWYRESRSHLPRRSSCTEQNDKSQISCKKSMNTNKYMHLTVSQQYVCTHIHVEHAHVL